MLTYVYCIVAADRRPSLARVSRGLPGASPVRLVDMADGRWLAVADVPAREYGEHRINRRLADLEWVSRAAVAHEAVVESFRSATAVLPLKLFTIFTSDARAVEDLHARRGRIESMIKRVARHDEFGVRVVLDRRKAAAAAQRSGGAGAPGHAPSGIAYLARKKAQRDAAAELAGHARDTVSDLYDRLAARARLARRRPAAEMPVHGGPLLLDAAYLVPRATAKSFRAEVARAARSLGRHGYDVTLSGPWPPYTFVKD